MFRQGGNAADGWSNIKTNVRQDCFYVKIVKDLWKSLQYVNTNKFLKDDVTGQ